MSQSVLAGRRVLLLTVALIPGACKDAPKLDSPPSLVESSQLPALSWERADVPIPTYTIANNGGALSTCHTLVSRPLPRGLQVNISRDRFSCEITGTPAALPDPTRPVRYFIYAANRFGLDSVQITVNPASATGPPGGVPQTPGPVDTGSGGPGLSER